MLENHEKIQRIGFGPTKIILNYHRKFITKTFVMSLIYIIVLLNAEKGGRCGDPCVSDRFQILTSFIQGQIDKTDHRKYYQNKI